MGALAAALLAALLLAAPVSAAVAAPGCPAADARERAGDLAGAEAAARDCLAAAPDDPQASFVLARALARQRRYGDARAVADRMTRAYPQDADWQTLLARIDFWRGDVVAAWERARQLPGAALADPETARFAADLAWYRAEWAEADRRYTALLARAPGDLDLLRRRGRAREELGRLGLAEADYAALCAAPGGACLPLDELKRRASTVTAALHTTWAAVPDGRDAWSVLGDVDLKPAPWIHLGLSMDNRWRDTAREVIHDACFEGSATLRFGRWSLRAAGGGTPDPDLAPTGSAQIEPSVAFDSGVQLFLKYWYLEYPDDAAHVVSPAVSVESGDAEFIVRYWLSIDDAGRPGHTLLGKAAYAFTDRVRAHVGGGWGDRTDYLSPADRRDAAVAVALAGVWVDLDWQYRLTFDYVFRYETASARSYQQHDLTLGVRVRF